MLRYFSCFASTFDLIIISLLIPLLILALSLYRQTVSSLSDLRHMFQGADRPPLPLLNKTSLRENSQGFVIMKIINGI